MDLTRFQFDYDLTFAMLMMNADGTIYGRYGSRSDHKEAERDISLPGLAASLQAVLHLHAGYPQNKHWLEGKQARRTEQKTPDDFPLLKGKYRDDLDYKGKVVQSCMHCHQIRDAQREIYRSAGKPIPDRLLFPYPMPRVVGITMDPETRANIKAVQAGSAAEKAGLRAGDELVALAGQPIISTADVQWILHQADDPGQLAVVVRRDGSTAKKEMILEAGWRRATDIGWRVSSWPLRRMGIGGLVLERVEPADRRELGVEADGMALRVKRVGQYGAHAAAKRAGFREGDILIAFDEQRTDMSESALLAYAAQHSRPGQQIPVSVLRNGKTVSLRMPMQR